LRFRKLNSILTNRGRARRAETPIDRNKAQFTLFAGKKRAVVAWPRGIYRASYSVSQDGRVVLEHSFLLSF